MSKSIDKNKVVVLTGAGVSAESGLSTFRDANGFWHRYSLTDVATPEAWQSNPQRVLAFYNERRRQVNNAVPNKAHIAIAELEQAFNVVVITQNVDDLHERAGSTKVIHLHGELHKARSSIDHSLIYPHADKDILIGETCEQGSQLRPHIVWFGENILHYNEALAHVKTAGKILVIGTSLTVYPAASLLKKARHHVEKIIISLDIKAKPFGYKYLRGSAGNIVPTIIKDWLA